MSTIGQRLRHARVFRNLTAEQLDQAAAVSLGTASRVETLVRSNKRDAAPIEALAAALGVRLVWLQRGEAAQGPVATAENCLQTVPHVVGQVDGRPAVLLVGPETFMENVVGTQHHHAEMVRILERSPGASKTQPASCSAWLVPDPSNAHDPRAVRVVVGELHVGHLPRERAASWQPILLALQRHHGPYVACPADVFRDDDKDGAPVYRINLAAPVLLPSVVIFDFGGR